MTAILLSLLAGAGVNVGVLTGASLFGVPALKVAKALTYAPTVIKVIKKIPKPEHVPEKGWDKETYEERQWRIRHDRW